MSIADCPNHPKCGHASENQCDADICGNRKTTGTKDPHAVIEPGEAAAKELRFIDWCNRHGMHQEDRDAFDDAYSLHLTAGREALEQTQGEDNPPTFTITSAERSELYLALTSTNLLAYEDWMRAYGDPLSTFIKQLRPSQAQSAQAVNSVLLKALENYGNQIPEASTQQFEDWADIERKHLGDSDKKTGIYAQPDDSDINQIHKSNAEMRT